MGLKDKLLHMIGQNQESDDYASEIEENEYEITPTSTQSAPKSQTSFSASQIEMKIVKPETFSDGNLIADHLLANRTVVVNFDLTNKENAKRLLDFLAGVAYSIGGQFTRVANNTFVITPENVDVSSDQIGVSSVDERVAQAPVVDLTSDTLF